MTTLHDRATGCLLGLASADALGGAVEFTPRHDLDRRFPEGVREITGGGPHRLGVGEWTDDTAMALAIGRACTPEGIDLDGVAANFVAWYRSGPNDIGIATANALRLVASGMHWREAGERLQAQSADGVAGNGTVMRCAPLALRFHRDPVRLREASIETARITHADPRATWGAVALNQALVHLLDGKDVDGLLDSAVRDVLEVRVVDAIQRAPGLSRDMVRSGGYVLDTLAAAFWCLLHTDTAEEAIVRAVGLGEDTDTTGAVTGALAGARYGADALPGRWLDVLHAREEIRDMAARLVTWGSSGS